MPFNVEALDRTDGELGAVTIELPLRRAGYLLPPWAELREMSAWCRDRSIALHIDGARIWEAAAAYRVAPADVAALADTVYVSFYKGLGGIGGAVLAGEADFVAALKPWRLRFGGNLFTAYPMALSALEGFDAQLPRMCDYVDRARVLADAIDARTNGIVHRPSLLANAFQAILPGSSAHLVECNRRFARERGVWLFNGFAEAPITGHSVGEIVMGDASDDWQPAEAAEWVTDFAATTT